MAVRFREWVYAGRACVGVRACVCACVCAPGLTCASLSSPQVPVRGGALPAARGGAQGTARARPC